MSTTGFGVCGHKNAYSTGVKIGNYVEERFGSQLARTGTSRPMSTHTEASVSYIDPRAMPDKCARAPMENLVERAMVRQGLPYDLVFEHGVPHIPTPDELSSKYTPTSLDFGSGLPASATASLNTEPTRARELELKRTRETREQKHMYTTSNQSIVPFVRANK